MNDKRFSGVREPDKPQKSRRKIEADRYRWHQRDHLLAIATFSELKPLQRAVYQTIIDYCYARRGPLPNDDVWLAKINNMDIRVYRRTRDELVALNRIVVDEDNGHVYDERTIRVLVGDEIFSATQAERASTGGGKGKKPARGKPQLSVIETNVAPISPETAAELDGTLAKRFAEPFPEPFAEPFPERLGLSSYGNEPKSTTWVEPDASHRVRTRDTSLLASSSVPGPAASPLNSGGGAEPKRKDWTPEQVAEWRRDQLKRMGKDETEPGASLESNSQKPKHRSKAADRKARRA